MQTVSRQHYFNYTAQPTIHPTTHRIAPVATRNTHGRPPTLVHRFDRLGTADRPPANLSLAPVGPTSTDWLGEGT